MAVLSRAQSKIGHKGYQNNLGKILRFPTQTITINPTQFEALNQNSPSLRGHIPHTDRIW